MNKLKTLIALAILMLVTCVVVASDPPPRYRLAPTFGDGYLWQWSVDEPYTVLSEMCWDDSLGFCDAAMQGGDTWREDNHFQWVYEIYDAQLGRYGSIYEADFGCYLLWWQAEHDEAGNPHMSEALWIECIPLA